MQLLNIQTLFTLLKKLTSQTDSEELLVTLNDVLENRFKDVEVTVYELHSLRQPLKKEQEIRGLDCLQRQKPIVIDHHPKMLEAFQSGQDVHLSEMMDGNRVVFPIKLYDNSISHLILLSHKYHHGGTEDILLGLMEIFRDLFRGIHEKGYDPLTRILNRQAFDVTVNKLTYELQPQPEVKLDRVKNFTFICIFDIDRFKQINDNYGHALGDETLVLFAQTIRTVCRQQDLFFRYGGEEFVLFLHEVDYLRAARILERCREAVETRRFPQVGQVTVSIGFAKMKPDLHPLEILSRADKALYYAKHNGRNQVHSYDKLLSRGAITPVESFGGEVDFWD